MTTVVGPFGLSVMDEGLEADVRAGLSAVEEGILEATKSDVPFITEAARHLVHAGGKRFRPLLAMLAAQFGDPHAPKIVPAAVVVELTHLATLYHDDVMDEAAVRRGSRAPTPAGTTRLPYSPATFCSPRPRTYWPTSGRRPYGSRPRPSSGWSPDRSWRPSARATGVTPSSTTWTSSRARPAP